MDLDVKWTTKKTKSGEIIYYQNTITGEKKWPKSSTEILQSFGKKTHSNQSLDNDKDGEPVLITENTFEELEPIDHDQASDTEIFPHVVHIAADDLTVHTLDHDELAYPIVYTDTEGHNTSTRTQHQEARKAYKNTSSKNISKTDINSNNVGKIPELKLIERDCPNIIESDFKLNVGLCDRQLRGSNITKKKTKKNDLKCEKCGTVFASKEKLADHQTFHSKNFKCDKCCQSFTSAVFLAKHRNIHFDRNLVKDQEIVSNIQELKNGNSLTCTHCAKEFTTEIEYASHHKCHQGIQLKCSQCAKTFTHRSALNHHLILHGSAKDDVEIRPDEKAKLDTKPSEEVTTTRKSGNKKFKCEECGKIFTNSGSFYVHRRRHSTEKPFKCSHCDKGFFEVGDLKKHLRSHTGEKPYSCKECGKRFTLSGNLKTHMRVHTGEKPFKCKICDKSFRKSWHLVVHLRTHSGEKPFQCNECNKTFSRRTCLTMHLRVHSGEKPFNCPKCLKLFSAKSDLSKHQRTHSGEKPYKCEDCDKTFSQLNHLKNHRRIHTGEKPYECQVCHQTFAHSQYLTRHKRIHSGEKPYECPHCKKRFAQRGKDGTSMEIDKEDVYKESYFRPRSASPSRRGRSKSPARRRSRSRSPARKTSTPRRSTSESPPRRGRSPGRPKKQAKAEKEKVETKREEKEVEETSAKVSQVKQTRSSHVEEETTPTRLTRSVTKKLVKEEKEALLDTKKLDEELKEKRRSRRPEYEFGGPIGVFFFMIALPALVYAIYFSYTGKKNTCTFKDYKKFKSKLPRKWQAYFNEGSVIAVGWVLFQAILYAIPFGRIAQGVALPDGTRLDYRINGFMALVSTLACVLLAKSKNVPFTFVNDKYLAIITSAIILSTVIAVFVYIKARREGTGLSTTGNTGNVLYDFFVGHQLNPRIGSFDLKFFFEMRPGLIGWLIINFCMANQEYKNSSAVSPAMIMVNIFQLIYVMDALLFEASILTTIDIVHEGFGFMLSFGNLVFVPFLFSLQATYLAYHKVTIAWPFLVAIIILKVVGFVIFRGSNLQKDYFKVQPNDPDFQDKETILTASGKKLMVFGWWRLVRHPNYLGDILMALSWSLTCGFSHLIPWLYPIYLISLLVHRQRRVEALCLKKYGKCYEEYCRRVPYRIFPLLY